MYALRQAVIGQTEVLAEFIDENSTKTTAPIHPQGFSAGGVTAAVLDELQHITLSRNASSQIQAVLYELIALKVQVIFISNFSHLWSLVKAPQQVKRRIFSDMYYLEPDTVGSETWVRYVSTVWSRFPGLFQLEAEVRAGEMHEFTFGIRDYFAHLSRYSLALALGAGRRHVTFEDYCKAYKSSRYASKRQDVEILLGKSPCRPNQRQDLFLPPELQGVRDEQERIARQNTQRERDIARRTVADALTVREREALRSAPRSVERRPPEVGAASLQPKTRPHKTDAALAELGKAYLKMSERKS